MLVYTDVQNRLGLPMSDQAQNRASGLCRELKVPTGCAFTSLLLECQHNPYISPSTNRYTNNTFRNNTLHIYGREYHDERGYHSRFPGGTA